jgi:hypothetical protein
VSAIEAKQKEPETMTKPVKPKHAPACRAYLINCEPCGNPATRRLAFEDGDGCTIYENYCPEHAIDQHRGALISDVLILEDRLITEELAEEMRQASRK